MVSACSEEDSTCRTPGGEFGKPQECGFTSSNALFGARQTQIKVRNRGTRAAGKQLGYLGKQQESPWLEISNSRAATADRISPLRPTIRRSSASAGTRRPSAAKHAARRRKTNSSVEEAVAAAISGPSR